MTSKHTTSCKPLLICVTKGSETTLELAAIANSLRWPSANCPLKVWVIDDAELIVSCENVTQKYWAFKHDKSDIQDLKITLKKGAVIYMAHGGEEGPQYNWILVHHILASQWWTKIQASFRRVCR